MSIGNYIKEHPIATGAIVIGGGLAFILLSGWFGGGSSAGTVTVSGPSAAQLQSETALQIAQMQQSGSLAAAKLGADTTIALAQLQAASEEGKTATALEALGLQLNASLQAITAQFQSENKKTDAGLAAMLAQFQTALAQSQNDNATALAMRQDDNAVTLAVAQLGAGVQNNQIDSSETVQLAMIGAQSEQNAGLLSLLSRFLTPPTTTTTPPVVTPPVTTPVTPTTPVLPGTQTPSPNTENQTPYTRNAGEWFFDPETAKYFWNKAGTDTSSYEQVSATAPDANKLTYYGDSDGKYAPDPAALRLYMGGRTLVIDGEQRRVNAPVSGNLSADNLEQLIAAGWRPNDITLGQVNPYGVYGSASERYSGTGSLH